MKIKVDGRYPCQICSKVLNTRDQFKRHIFYRHQEDQVQTAYLQSLDDLIGSTVLDRICRAILQEIVKGNWRHHILVQMCERAPFNLSGVS